MQTKLVDHLKIQSIENPKDSHVVELTKTRNAFQKDRRHDLQIDNFSMVQINAIRVQLAVPALVNSVLTNLPANMASGAR